MKKFVYSICALFAAATISFAQDVNEATDLFNAAVEYLNLGDKTSALENFQKAYDIAKECGEAGQALVDQCESTIPQLALMVAKDYVKAGDYATAVAKAKEASAIAASMNADSVVAEADALVPNIYMQQGNVLIKAKDYEGAIADCSQAIRLNPYIPDIFDLRAMSQGRGSYTLKFVRYEEVPQMNQAKIIEDAKKEEEEA